MRGRSQNLNLPNVDSGEQDVAPKGKEQRKEERVRSEMLVDLGTGTGVARDVSASGIFFEVDASYKLGGTVVFSVEMNTPGGKMMLHCHGNIVRIEPREKKVGVAVKITDSVIEPWHGIGTGNNKAQSGSAGPVQ